jgi:glycosyltransferase involved in cell wall biosynthesis
MGLARLGYRVTVCCIDRTYRDVEPLRKVGVEVLTLRASGKLSRFLAVPRLARLARRADVVHCTMWDASLWGRLAAIAARRPVIVADHATDRSVQVSARGAPRARWVALHNRLLDWATFATVACAISQLRLLRREGVAEEKLVYIPNGVPVDELKQQARNGPTRTELGIPENAKVVAHVGVFRLEKNQTGSLETVARLRERLGDVRLVFVGDGPERPAVERRARELQADWALFLGLRQDVPGLLSLADLMILPSLADALPMTLLEAMAVGVPVVASDVGDVASVLRASGGICVPRGDQEAFVQACLEMLADEPTRRELAERAEAVARRFDAQVMVERYTALFNAACSGRPPHPAAHASDGALPNRE